MKKAACNAEDTVSLPGSGRSPGEGNGNPLQYSCLGNPMDRGAWWPMDLGVARVEHNFVTKLPPSSQGYGVMKKTTVIYVPRRYNCCCCLLFSCYIVSESFATPWTLAHQAPLCMGFPRQEYWSGLPSPSLGNVPNPETETSSPTLTGRFFTTEPSWKPQIIINVEKIHVSKTN